MCVSCYNRSIEFKRGRNANGTRPRIVLAERRVGAIVDFDKPGETWRVDIADEFTFDTVELVTQILRVAVGRVAFVALGRASVAVSLQEFTKIMAGRLPARPARRRLRGAARRRRP